MTDPGHRGDPDDPDRIPTQAELDAEDLAELERTSRDADIVDRYPRRRDDPGPAPRVLAHSVRVVWWIAAAAAAAYVVAGFVQRGTITDLLAGRLEPGLAEVNDADAGDAADRAQSMAQFWPPALLIGMVVLMALSYPLLVGIAGQHSRNLRSMYAAVVVVAALFTPVIGDLLFSYDEINVVVRALPWVQFAALLLTLLMVFRRAVNQWLPTSNRVKPGRMLGRG
ncbi:hypothetical protein [Gordonia sp. VNK21]|uniref:hypothetical protein n=1 Tax=Gordonia sp. VNK21 TaxID=3382483 RepID=UPI0038D45EF1